MSIRTAFINRNQEILYLISYMVIMPQIVELEAWDLQVETEDHLATLIKTVVEVKA